VLLIHVLSIFVIDSRSILNLLYRYIFFGIIAERLKFSQWKYIHLLIKFASNMIVVILYLNQKLILIDRKFDLRIFIDGGDDYNRFSRKI